MQVQASKLVLLSTDSGVPELTWAGLSRETHRAKRNCQISHCTTARHMVRPESVTRHQHFTGVKDGADPEVEPDDRADLLEESPMQKIAKLLEENMLAGWSQLRCYQWCIEFGIDRPTFDRMWDDIKRSWKMPTMTFSDFCDQRDLARARYTKVFNLSMKRNQVATALAAVEKIVKLDGLDQPAQLQITLNQNSTPGQITNAARDHVAQLMEKARRLAAPTDDDIGPIIEEPLTKVSNGHHKIGRDGIIEIEGTYLPGDPRGEKS